MILQWTLQNIKNRMTKTPVKTSGKRNMDGRLLTAGTARGRRRTAYKTELDGDK